MIRIRKPLDPPKRLAIEGKRKRRSHCSSYSRNPEAYRSGTRKFEFDRTIYAHESVKQALIEAQHGKCCFCERRIDCDGDVEHFRPKQAYKQAEGESLQRPGYYWLAYEWDNLYLACTGCNQRHKQNLFPLQDPVKRLSHHNQSLEQEQPLFIDPGNDNPEEFIGFRGEVALAIEGNSRGKTTIDALSLNHRSLPELRLDKLRHLKLCHDLVQLAVKQPPNSALQEQADEAKALADEAKILLDKALKDNAEFSAAARCAIQTGFKFVY